MTVKTKSSKAPAASIWSQPEPGARRPRHSREQIAEAALALADREGFAAVSMRRVAEELGAATMTLYYYIRTKEDLVTLMDDALMAEVLVAPELLAQPWREALNAIAWRTREVFVRHPWALHELRGARQGPNAMRHVEQSLEAVADAPLDDDGRIALLGLVDDFVFGHALRSQMEWKRPAPDDVEGQQAEAFMGALLASGEFPRLAAVINDAGVADGPEGHAWARQSAERNFQRGLDAIFDAVPSWSQAPAAAKKRKR